MRDRERERERRERWRETEYRESENREREREKARDGEREREKDASRETENKIKRALKEALPVSNAALMRFGVFTPWCSSLGQVWVWNKSQGFNPAVHYGTEPKDGAVVVAVVLRCHTAK